MRFDKFLLMAAVAAFAAVSCDKANNGTDPSESVAGTYSGYSTAEFQYSPDPMVSVSYVSDTWGKFTVNDAKVSESGDDFSIKGEGSTLMGMQPGSEQEYPCTFTGTVSGDKTDFSFVFDVPGVMGGLKISVLPGTAPSAEK